MRVSLLCGSGGGGFVVFNRLSWILGKIHIPFLAPVVTFVTSPLPRSASAIVSLFGSDFGAPPPTALATPAPTYGLAPASPDNYGTLAARVGSRDCDVAWVARTALLCVLPAAGYGLGGSVAVTLSGIIGTMAHAFEYLGGLLASLLSLASCIVTELAQSFSPGTQC